MKASQAAKGFSNGESQAKIDAERNFLDLLGNEATGSKEERQIEGNSANLDLQQDLAPHLDDAVIFISYIYHHHAGTS